MYVYVLQSEKDKKFYTGFTKDLNRRIEEHNEGKNCSTKDRLPFNLIYYEWCLSQQDATAREKYLKSGMGKRYIRNRLKFYLREREEKQKSLTG
ncbi:MAG: GIY-YIG nuclease family protein [Candidatus Omnitrophica bacterium]|nr:GIY-YIG nuclease family protein [Candidatus Omnitrophota bacterium]